MKFALFSTKSNEGPSLMEANLEFGHELFFFDNHLKRISCSIDQKFPLLSAYLETLFLKSWRFRGHVLCRL
jgi:hypothetical protein